MTRVHSLSRDGRNWEPAGRVHEVFNPDGSVASDVRLGADEEAEGVDPDLIPVELEVPTPRSQRRAEPSPSAGAVPPPPPPSPPGAVAWSPPSFTGDAPVGPSRASVRPVVVLALVLGTVMLAVPSSRAADGTLGWWWSEGVLGVAVRGVSLLALTAFWVIAFLRPDAIRATLVASAAGVLAIAAALPVWDFASWAIPAAALVPTGALLLAVGSASGSTARSAGTAAAAVAIPSCAASGILVLLHPGTWALVGVGLAVVGAAAIAAASIRMTRSGRADGLTIACCSTAAAGGIGAMFAAGILALEGPDPLAAARAAASAGIVLAFSALAWAAAHEAVQWSHTILSEDDSVEP